MVESAQSREETQGLEQLHPSGSCLQILPLHELRSSQATAAGRNHHFTLFILPDVSARLVTGDSSLLLDTPVVGSTGSLPSC